ncbi:MAG: hypothetical protein BGO78_12855 [Chloroflexi bacterium 44-23]|nr:MAG: hypothetical protein BGO78_12855 [Chloroflexi bacterium 44-23]
MKNNASPKDKLFQTAAKLFFQYGYRAVGVDMIAAESGISKMTLYRHYPSKDDLIIAFLKESDDDFWSYFEDSTQGALSAQQKLLAFFQGLQEYVTTPACYGCPFLNIVAEYPQNDYPGHQIAQDHKLAVRERFWLLAKEAGAKDASALADQLILLMDGAYMASRMFGSVNPAVRLAEAARVLIDSALEK